MSSWRLRNGSMETDGLDRGALTTERNAPLNIWVMGESPREVWAGRSKHRNLTQTTLQRNGDFDHSTHHPRDMQLVLLAHFHPIAGVAGIALHGCGHDKDSVCAAETIQGGHGNSGTKRTVLQQFVVQA